MSVPGLPPPGTFILGSWLTWYLGDLDTPSQFNSRLGYKAGSFQNSQSIPPAAQQGQGGVYIDPQSLLNWNDNSKASFFLTIYADQSTQDGSGLQLATPEQLTLLAYQINNITTLTGRQVYLRYLPEMNGEWMIYGVQPQAYVQNWISMYNVIKSIAPQTALVWSPNFDLSVRGDDGSFGNQPYWPGAQYVDWVGASQYFKPDQSACPDRNNFCGNQPPGPTYFVDSISYVYNTYAVGYNKPFVVSEAAAAWEISSSVHPADAVTQEELQQNYWSQVFSSVSSLPLFKMIHIFEHDKQEDNLERDFRVTWNPAVKQGFIQALQPLIDSQVILWGDNPNLPSAGNQGTFTALTNPVTITTTTAGGASSNSASASGGASTTGTGLSPSSTKSGANIAGTSAASSGSNSATVSSSSSSDAIPFVHQTTSFWITVYAAAVAGCLLLF